MVFPEEISGWIEMLRNKNCTPYGDFLQVMRPAVCDRIYFVHVRREEDAFTDLTSSDEKEEKYTYNSFPLSPYLVLLALPSLFFLFDSIIFFTSFFLF